MKSGTREILLDWQLVDLLNNILKTKKIETERHSLIKVQKQISFIKDAEEIARMKLEELNTPFSVPEIKPLALFLPN
ncbi:MAG: hypothetical protein C4582_05345 [Desulfobacteraceae bacterium]|nr:MAG: hypothetical protein C4582_05345 [Desulfobacteraceae bacterium]